MCNKYFKSFTENRNQNMTKKTKNSPTTKNVVELLQPSCHTAIDVVSATNKEISFQGLNTINKINRVFRCPQIVFICW